ncbi:intraflagellar transport protein 81 homolog [Exaiptasia diaphana]|uniref:Intraflagellar transport protein 81 homolog n=1 Tax=Exaiptasia diaphana TaxID=2652724 RepID=A0A913WWI2_EXADI|nr:intraflagellar transport protein 81 homolog [Exaiptasia diaphana]KXJ17310.1 Intraflagellar transport protein 81-like [Exaiptasia diaphana]
MSAQLKYIVDELNKEPFKKNYNLISFDSLQPLQLLQVLNDVFAEVNPQHKIDLREEDPEAMAVRMFNFLRVLKYKPKTEAGSLAPFRQGLVQGEKQVIYPILQWLFERLPDLRKRAYLARFLVRMEIPGDLLADQELFDLNESYAQLIEEFKECHKEAEQLRSSGFSASEIKKDIMHMEEEHGQLKKRIERMQKKVESVRNYEQMLQAARNLRVEREQESSLAQQKLEQKTQLLHADQRFQRMTHQLKDLRAQGIGTTGADLIRRLDEENKVNVYLCQDKLPKEIEGKQKYSRDLQKVANEPAMGHSDLDELNKNIKTLSSEINSLIEKRMVRNDPIDDKLSLFRQQASIIARKKESSAEKLKEAMDECSSTETELQKKRDLLKDSEGAEVLKGDEFKRYVNKLRGKSTVYKKKRQELAELRAEYGVLSRSEEILKSKYDDLSSHLSTLENKQGVSGYHDTQEELEKVSAVKSDLDEQKGKTLDDISDLVVTMNATISEKKSALAPVIKELRPMRQKCQEITEDYEEKKAQYENLAAGLESNLSKLEQEVRGLREEISSEESRYHYLQCMMKVLEVQQKRIEDEMNAYRAQDPAERKKSWREQYTKKIQEQENLGKSLREKQKAVRESHGPNMKQMKMWSDLTKLLECKKNCLLKKAGGESVSAVPAERGTVSEDVLVL